MMIRKTATTVGTLAHGAVSTAVGVVKHPIGTASMAVGLAKGVAGAGLDLVRGGHADVEQDEALSSDAPVSSDARTASEAPVEETRTVEHDPRDDLPGPDLAHFEPPAPEDLPEPIVIEADDAPTNGESGEAFHHEPKVASREVAHGEPGTDFEQAEGFADEIPDEISDDLEVGRQP
jgi:hypothetical protein